MFRHLIIFTVLLNSKPALGSSNEIVPAPDPIISRHIVMPSNSNDTHRLTIVTHIPDDDFELTIAKQLIELLNSVNKNLQHIMQASNERMDRQLTEILKEIKWASNRVANEADGCRNPDGKETDSPRNSEPDEADSRRSPDAKETDSRRNPDGKGTDSRRNSEPDEADSRRNPDGKGTDSRRNPDGKGTDSRRNSEPDEADSRRNPDGKGTDSRRNSKPDEADSRRNPDGKETDSRRNLEPDEADRRRNPDGKETDGRRNPDGKETDSRRNSEPDEADSRRNSDGKETDSRRNPDGKETDSRRNPDGKETDSRRNSDGKETDSRRNSEPADSRRNPDAKDTDSRRNPDGKETDSRRNSDGKETDSCLNRVANKSSELPGKSCTNSSKQISQKGAYPTSCVKLAGGLQFIQIDKFCAEPFFAYCDNVTQGGGWMVIQRRMDGCVDFYRNLAEYKQGFGNLVGEFFIGLEKLHALTATSVNELLIVIRDQDGKERFAKYEAFAIADESEGYWLKVLGKYSGDAGNWLAYAKFGYFCTKDSKTCLKHDCGGYESERGWWQNDYSCSWSMNGKYLKSTSGKGIQWKLNGDWAYSLPYTQMMIRPKS